MYEQALTKLFKPGDIVVGETGTSGKTPTPSKKKKKKTLADASTSIWPFSFQAAAGL